MTSDDIQVAIRALIDQARAGNVVACRELLDRVLGKPEPIDILERLEELEVALERATRRSA
ncbi:MAG: hypothetical protein ACI9OJ_000857 [Myxococcota bacterium]